MREAPEHIMKAPNKRPCTECPWRRDSLRSYLGPHDADEWLAMAHGESQIACHVTIPEGTPEDGSDLHEMTQCAGAAIFRANVFKSPRWATADEHLPRDTDTVFAWNDEFKDHHEFND